MSKEIKEEKKEECWTCKGKGWFEREVGGSPFGWDDSLCLVPCRDCNGTGKVKKEALISSGKNEKFDLSDIVLPSRWR